MNSIVDWSIFLVILITFATVIAMAIYLLVQNDILKRENDILSRDNEDLRRSIGATIDSDESVGRHHRS